MNRSNLWIKYCFWTSYARADAPTKLAKKRVLLKYCLRVKRYIGYVIFLKLIIVIKSSFLSHTNRLNNLDTLLLFQRNCHILCISLHKLYRISLHPPIINLLLWYSQTVSDQFIDLCPFYIIVVFSHENPWRVEYLDKKEFWIIDCQHTNFYLDISLLEDMSTYLYLLVLLFIKGWVSQKFNHACLTCACLVWVGIEDGDIMDDRWKLAIS